MSEKDGGPAFPNVGGTEPNDLFPKQWGPFGAGKWKGHPGVYCKVCGWPVYNMWLDPTVPPPGECSEGRTSARSCSEVLERLMSSAWVREACGGKPPHEATEMMRKTTGLSWDEIERMSDATGKASHTIAQMRSERLSRTQGVS